MSEYAGAYRSAADRHMGPPMHRDELLHRTEETLRPFETENIVRFIRELNFHSFIHNPLMMLVLFFALVYGLKKHSRFTLLLVFSAVSLALLIHFTFPAPGATMSTADIATFVAGCLVVAGVIIYTAFIKTE